MADATLIYHVNVGFDPDRGYSALLYDAIDKKMKAIRGNSMEQLTSRIRRVLIDEEGKRRRFPLESEPSRIISNGF